MKFFKYAVIALAVFFQSGLYAQNAEPNNAPLAETETKLSEEELVHRHRQEQIDQSAIETVEHMQSFLNRGLDLVESKSPVLGGFLKREYFGIALVRYVVSALILFFTFVILKYSFNFLFARLLALSNRNGQSGFWGEFIAKIRKPVNMVVWVLGIYFAIAFLFDDLGVIKITSRAIGILFWCALFWAVVILADALFFVANKKLKGKSAKSTVNLLEFLRRVVKIFIVVIAVLSILTNCGVNVNTIIASLGIGGMALAFASQDTIANFFGSVSIILDRPFIVGDWVKTSCCEGNVDAIGFRSTRIKTFSNTMVTIPNSILAKDSVENMSKMPVRKVNLVLGFTYSSTPEQISEFLPKLRSLVLNTDGVAAKNGARAEFLNFGSSSLDISLVYYTKEIDYANYADVQTRVNLGIMRLAQECGLSFAFPSTSIYIEEDNTKKHS